MIEAAPLNAGINDRPISRSVMDYLVVLQAFDAFDHSFWTT